MTPTRILVLGATSGIAQHVARRLVAPGVRFFLVGRDAAKLAAVAGDLRVRGAAVESETADLDDLAGHDALVARADAALGGMDLAIAAQGALGDPAVYDRDGAAAARLLHANLVAPVSILTAIARTMEPRGQGCICGFSSVAGDRGRRVNAVYGAGKAGFSAFLSGLRSRLEPSGVRVLTVKPGPTATAMTARMPKAETFAPPDAVADDVVRAIRRDADVLYTPWKWRVIMWVVRAIPERVFKRLAF